MDNLVCPKCQRGFTYLEREEHGGRFPLALNCGHRLCYACVRDFVLTERNERPTKPHRAGDVFCTLCHQKQPPVNGLERQDLIRRFPIDFAAVGVLVALDSFGPNIVRFAGKLHPQPTVVRPVLEDSLALECGEREDIRLERNDACFTCAGIVCEWKCLQCKQAFCLDCWPQHGQACPSSASDVVPFDSNGYPMEGFHTCQEHGLLQQWHCDVHPHHNAVELLCVVDAQNPQKKRLYDCSYTMKAEKNEDTIPDFRHHLALVNNLIGRTRESLVTIRGAKGLLQEAHKSEQLMVHQFFSRLLTSTMFSCNNLTMLQQKFSGRFLGAVETMQAAINSQMKWSVFSLERWNILVSSALTLPVNLNEEKAALERIVHRCRLWTPEIQEVCMEATYVSEATWADGLPQGLRMIFAKTRKRLIINPGKIQNVIKLEPVEDIVTIVKEDDRIVCYDLKYSLEFFSEETEVSAPAFPVVDEFEQLKNTIFHIQGLIPRLWFPEHENIIDSNPTVCRVTFVENDPLVLWIRSAAYDGQYKELRRALDFYCQNAATVETVSVGGIYGVYVGKSSGPKRDPSKDYGWMRVRITVQRGGDGYSGHLLDHGKCGVWKLQDLRAIPQTIKRLEPLANRAKLHDFVPYFKKQADKWAPNVDQYVLDWLKFSGSPFVLLEDYVAEGKFLLVDMWSDSRVPSLRDFLVLCGVGQAKIMSDAMQFELHRNKQHIVKS